MWTVTFPNPTEEEWPSGGWCHRMDLKADGTVSWCAGGPWMEAHTDAHGNNILEGPQCWKKRFKHCTESDASCF